MQANAHHDSQRDLETRLEFLFQGSSLKALHNNGSYIKQDRELHSDSKVPLDYRVHYMGQRGIPSHKISTHVSRNKHWPCGSDIKIAMPVLLQQC